MTEFFDNIINNITLLDLAVNFEFEYLKNRKDKQSIIENFILNQKQKLIDVSQRLTPQEKILYFDKLENEFASELSISKNQMSWFKKYFFEKELTKELLMEAYPEHNGKDNFTLSMDDWYKYEQKYSLYPLFKEILNELNIFVIKIRNCEKPCTIIKVKTPLKFIELFKHPYNNEKKINELKNILKIKGYIDENNKWNGLTDIKNELATLYWLFKDEKYNIIAPGKIEPQLKTFYKEFGLIVYNEKEPKGYCSIKTISKTPGYTEIYKEFENIFSNWFDKD